MAHVKRGMVSRRKHKKLLKLAKGYWGTKNRSVKRAKEAVLHAGAYAFHGRKTKKRTLRALWTVRISEALKQDGIPYHTFINKLKKENIELDRKILSNLVVEDPETFKHIAESLKNV